MQTKSIIISVAAVLLVVLIVATQATELKTTSVYATDDSAADNGYNVDFSANYAPPIGQSYRHQYIAYLKFGELSGFSSDFETAILHLYFLRDRVGTHISTNNMTICLHLVLEDWVESDITSWNTRKPYSSECFATYYTGYGLKETGNYDYYIDISDVVRGWINGTIPNYGIAFTYVEGINSRLINFVGKDGLDPSNDRILKDGEYLSDKVARIEFTYKLNWYEEI